MFGREELRGKSGFHDFLPTTLALPHIPLNDISNDMQLAMEEMIRSGNYLHRGQKGKDPNGTYLTGTTKPAGNQLRGLDTQSGARSGFQLALIG